MKSASQLRSLVVTSALGVLVTALACGSSASNEPESAGGSDASGGNGGNGAAGADVSQASTTGDGGVPSGAAGAGQGTGATQSDGGTPSLPSGGVPAAAGTPPEDGGGAGGSDVVEIPVGPFSGIVRLSGDITDVHDPAIVRDGNTFYLFSTGKGIQVRTSQDLRVWQSAGQVFSKKPSWITTTDANDPNFLWAPEVLFFGGEFHLYYAASQFGARRSCMGHASKVALGGSEEWTDHGAVLCSNVEGPIVNYNAIDPNPFEDAKGKLWLSFGSFWDGLKLIRMDADGNRDGPDLFSIATRPNTAVEAPHLFYREGYYYLFESVDSCCKGVDSTYKIMVGRGSKANGPFVDADGVALIDGGGSLVLEGGSRWRGPGHNAILSVGDQDLNVYHSYDANHGGVPTLRISELTWTNDGWPVSAGP